MAKYSNLLDDVYSVFGTNEWSGESILTFPENFTGNVPGKEYIRVHILPNGEGINLQSVSGQVIIDIFVPAGGGPSRVSTIADRLDIYLVGKSINTGSGVTQFQNSSLSNFGPDKANGGLFRSMYSISFNYFGV